MRENSGANMKLLDPDIDQTQSREDHAKKEKDKIKLESCFNAFSREELLTGSD